MSNVHQHESKTKTEFKSNLKDSSVEGNAPVSVENPAQMNKQSPGDNLLNMARDGVDSSSLDFSEMNVFKESLPIAMRSMSPGALKAYYDLQNQGTKAFSVENMQFYNTEKSEWIENFKSKLVTEQGAVNTTYAEDIYPHQTLSDVVRDLKNYPNFFPGTEYKNFRTAAVDFEEYIRNGKIDIVNYSSKFSSTIDAVTKYIDTHSKAKSRWGKRRLNMAKSIRAKMENAMNPVTYFAGRFKDYGAVIKMDSKATNNKLSNEFIKAPDYLDIAKHEGIAGKVVSDNIGRSVEVEEIIAKNSVIDTVVSSSTLVDGQKDTATKLCSEIKTATKEHPDGGPIKTNQVVKTMVLSVFSSKIKKVKEQLSNLDKKKEEALKIHNEKLNTLNDKANKAKEKYGESQSKVTSTNKEIEKLKNSSEYKLYVNDKKTAIKHQEDILDNARQERAKLQKQLDAINSPESEYSQKIERAKNESPQSIKVSTLNRIREGEFKLTINGEEKDLINLDTKIETIEKALNDDSIFGIFTKNLEDSVDKQSNAILNIQEKKSALLKELEAKKENLSEVQNKQNEEKTTLQDIKDDAIKKETEYNNLRETIFNGDYLSKNIQIMQTNYNIEWAEDIKTFLSDKILTDKLEKCWENPKDKNAKKDFKTYYDSILKDFGYSALLEKTKVGIEKTISNYNKRAKIFNDELKSKVKTITEKKNHDILKTLEMKLIDEKQALKNMKFQKLPSSDDMINRDKYNEIVKEAEPISRQTAKGIINFTETTLGEYEDKVALLNSGKYNSFIFKDFALFKEDNSNTKEIEKNISDMEVKISKLENEIDKINKKMEEFNSEEAYLINNKDESLQKLIVNKGIDLKNYAKAKLGKANEELKNLVLSAEVDKQRAINDVSIQIEKYDGEIKGANDAINKLTESIKNYDKLKELEKELKEAQDKEEQAKSEYEKKEQEAEEFKTNDPAITTINKVIENKDHFNNDVNKLALINDAVAHFFNASENIAEDINVKIDGYDKISSTISIFMDEKNIFTNNLTNMIYSFAEENGEKYGVNFTEADETSIKNIVDTVWKLYSDLSKATETLDDNNELDVAQRSIVIED